MSGKRGGDVHHIGLMAGNCVEAPFLLHPVANPSPDFTIVLWYCDLFNMEFFLDCQIVAADEFLQFLCTFSIDQKSNPHLPELLSSKFDLKN